MGRVGGVAFVAVENFPACEILFESARVQAVRAFYFAWLGDVDDGNEDAAGGDAALGRLE